MVRRAAPRSAWHPRLRERAGDWPARLADAIAADVASGRLAPGARLPTQRVLARKLGITPGTVNRAYAAAARAGLVRGEVGRGTYVLSRGEEGFYERGVHAGAGTIDLALNYPPGIEAERALPEVLRALAKAPPRGPLAAAPYGGNPRARSGGAAWLRSLGLDEASANVLVTTSVQHGVGAALAVLAAPGDTVLTEELTSPGLLELAASRRLRLVPVACDAEGLLPDALAEARERTGARVLYTMPTLHTPTAATMGVERRRAVAQAIARTGLVAIEDDAWGFLAAGTLQPLRALAPQHVLYLTSMSKSLAPGLRVGYAACPPRLARTLAEALGATTWAMPLGVEIVTRWVEDGTAARIVERRRRAARVRRRLATARLGAWLTPPTLPSYHVWVRLPDPWRAADFVAAAAAGGVALAASASFAPPRSASPTGVRVCLGTEPEPARLARGLDLLADLLARGSRAEAQVEIRPGARARRPRPPARPPIAGR